MSEKKKVIIMGAAGKDFHVFNTCYRDDPQFQVMAFTAAQIPNISNRTYPKVLAGQLYEKGIPIKPEARLVDLIKEERVDEVVFAYSDVSYAYIAEKEALVREAGANFKLFDDQKTLLPSIKPVIAVCAVRTGCGKSPTSRLVLKILKELGKRVVVVRHPMPYGDLTKQVVQRFEKLEDLQLHNCTIEEMEEYEPHIENGAIVFAGVDYEKILRAAEKEADVIVWDGGNNDIPCFKANLLITLVDPLRAGDELLYFPGRINFERANVIIISKVGQAPSSGVEIIEKNIQQYNPQAVVLKGALPITVDNPELMRDKRALVVEDGPTLTHGGMKYGAGVIAAKNHGVKAIIDPRPFVVGEIAKIFEKYPNIGKVLPALGYGEQQIRDLEETINQSDAEVVVIATPINLGRLIKINKPYVDVSYELEIISRPNLEDLIKEFIKTNG